MDHRVPLKVVVRVELAVARLSRTGNLAQLQQAALEVHRAGEDFFRRVLQAPASVGGSGGSGGNAVTTGTGSAVGGDGQDGSWGENAGGDGGLGGFAKSVSGSATGGNGGNGGVGFGVSLVPERFVDSDGNTSIRLKPVVIGDGGDGGDGGYAISRYGIAFGGNAGGGASGGASAGQGGNGGDATAGAYAQGGGAGTGAIPVIPPTTPIEWLAYPLNIGYPGRPGTATVTHETAPGSSGGSSEAGSEPTRAGYSPANLSDLFKRLTERTRANGDANAPGTPEGVSTELVGTPNDPMIIVYLGGTDDKHFGQVDLAGLTIGDSGTNQPIGENVTSYVFRQPKPEHIKAIDEAVAKAPNAKVMLVGYSQGGMDAQNIAASGKYNVTSVVTYGSPIVQPASKSYTSIHLWDTRDNIARLTFLGNAEYERYYHDVNQNGQLYQSQSSVQDSPYELLSPNQNPVAKAVDVAAIVGLLEISATGDGKLFEQWYAIHTNGQTYKEIASQFSQVADLTPNSPFGESYAEVQKYLDKPDIVLGPGMYIDEGGYIVSEF